MVVKYVMAAICARSNNKFSPDIDVDRDFQIYLIWPERTLDIAL